MSVFYATYPNTGTAVPIYPTFSAFPSTAVQGSLAVAADSGILYEFNGTTWVVVGGTGVPISVGTIDSTSPSSNGASIVASALIMQSASAGFPGLVNNTTQIFTGLKTFNDGIALNAQLITGVLDPVSPQDAATKNYVDTMAASGANTFLSNLTAPTAVNIDLLSVNGSINIGSTTSPWGTIYATGWNDSNDHAALIINNINRRLADTSGNLSLDFSGRTLYRTGGVAMLGWGGAGVIDMHSTRLTNVVDPTSAQDAATKNYSDAGTATLTNKSISGSTNTITNISLTTSVTGILPIANGGSGAATTSQNFAFIGPTSGSGAPSFRAIVAGDIPTLNQNTTGSAATLTTPRTINGVAFDGSANITITAVATKYTQAFVVADWVVAGADYTLTITGATHGRGLFPAIQVSQSAAGVNTVTYVTTAVTAANGNILLTVSGTPDNRFDGSLIVV